MKKFIVVLLAALALSVPAFALEADVAPFEVWLHNQKLEHRATEYPLLVYKDITYFPMTYDYVHRLGLTSSWVDGCFYLSYCPVTSSAEEAPAYAPEVSKIKGEIASYPIYINGKLLDNSKEEYPVFNARGITYFPMTWRFATEEFGLSCFWDGKLMIGSGRGVIGGNDFRVPENGRLYFDRQVYETYQSEENPGYLGHRYIGDKNYVFDPAARTVTESEYMPKDYLSDYSYRGRIDEKLKISGNYLMYENILIDDLADYVAAEKTRETPLGINVFGYEFDLGGGKTLINVDMNYKTQYVQPHTVSPTSLWFIRNADGSFGKLTFEHEAGFKMAEYIDGKRYLSLEFYDRMGSFYDQYGCKTYIVNDDNSLTPVEDADHGNVRLVGQSGGKPVVLATWKYEREGVSAVNDGYFAIESDGSLNKIYPYVYSDGEISYNGHLYLLIWRNNTIVDITAGEEIEF
ncbi:MAG: hypothetical protein J1F63_10880 [Oscillospiraceae bacterium]|nr:hypothetical protein [Oscillospiraceae bacterium]